MVKGQPSRTINRLHFEDLEPRRFEDLCHALVYSFQDWAELTHPGRSGNDDGIDINGVEKVEDGDSRQWVIQCKRYKTFTPQQAKDTLDKAADNGRISIDVFLLVVGCDVSKTTVEEFKLHAAQLGIKETLIWDASYLESMLYNDRQDLLFTYFGVNIRAEKQNREALIKRRLALKAKMRRDFLITRKEWEERNEKYGVISSFESANVLIRNVDDDTYPEMVLEEGRISQWFKTEPLDFYYNGFEIVLGIETAIFDDQGMWDILESADKRRGKYKEVNVYVIGRIPYDNIVEYDMDGELCPHIYCRFSNNGTPYENIVYGIPSKTYVEPLDNKKRVKLP